MAAAIDQPWVGQEQHAGSQAPAALSDLEVEAAALNETDGVARSDFLARVAVGLVRGMVEAAQDDQRRSDQWLEAVHRRRCPLRAT